MVSLRAAAEPRFHDTLTLKVVGRPEGLRVVVTADGILGSVVRFLELPRNRDKSPSWQNKACRAVGLLYDYFVAVPDPTDLTGRRSFLSNFVRHLMVGTISPDGSDSTGLFWRPVSNWTKVKETLSFVTAFADHCATKDGIKQLNPEVGASFANRVAKYRQLDIQSSHSLLKHLGNAKVTFEAARRSREIRARREPKVTERRPPYFPHDGLRALLEKGLRLSETGSVHRRSLREIMIVMLQRFGGLRSSEPFHIFTRDVREDPDCPGHALVRLYHPELGLFRYPDPLTRRIIQTTRLEYLQQQYGRRPRNRIAGKGYVGWKNLMLDEGKPHYYAIVRWFPQEAGAVFWQLYQAYVTHVLPPGLNHPYLFVTLNSGLSFGQPYQLAAYYKNLRRAVESIGLKHLKSQGTTSHGLRHAYGQSLSEAKVDKKVIQICMHHTSLHSQEAYTRPDQANVSRELEAARLRIAKEQADAFAVPNLAAIGLHRSLH